MKVRVLSDLHLEFGDFDPGEGDVLVLAGDICDAVAYIHRCDEDYRERYQRFFSRCVLNYNKVFYVMGNHEHYNCAFLDTPQILRDKLPEGITLLDNSSEFYEGWHFVGATMWTDFAGKEENRRTAERCLNDYNYIFQDRYCRKNIDADFIAKQNDNTRVWLNQCLPTLRGNVMVITHHAPSYDSIDEDYVMSDTVSAYASNMNDFIKSQPNVKVWVHGHIHSSKDYKIGDCRVICNPRGYHKEGENLMFNPNMQLDLSKNEKAPGKAK